MPKTQTETANVQTEALERILQHLAAVQWADIPQDIRDRGHWVVADVLGCMLSGHLGRAPQLAWSLMGEWGGKAESTVFGWGARIPAPHAAFINAMSARAYDFGPVETGAGGSFRPLHISETLVPVALAMGEYTGASGKDVLTALIMGEDLTGRLGAAMNLPRPVDCRGTLNTLGAAAVAGKLMHFTPQQYADAFGLALHQLNGVKQGVFFQYGQACSAMNGILSARMAALGACGADSLEEEFRRLAAIFAEDIVPEVLFEHLGTVFYNTTTFKLYPGCRATHGAVECALRMVQQNRFSAEDIQSVTLKVSPWTRAHLVGRPFTLRRHATSDAIYSIEYALASALLRKKCSVEYLEDKAVRDPLVRQLIDKISLTTEGWPVRPDDSFLAVELQVTLLSGETCSEYTDVPRGNEIFSKPLSEEEKTAKFRLNVARVPACAASDGSCAEKLLAIVRRLDQLPDLSALSAFFRAV